MTEARPEVLPVVGPLFVRRSDLVVWAVPVRLGAAAPKAKRAARAGFGARAGQVAEVVTRKRRRLLVRVDDDLEAAGALMAARLGSTEHFAIDARGWPPREAVRLAAGAALRAWRYRELLTQDDPERAVLESFQVMVDDADVAETMWRQHQAGVQGALLARGLVVRPSNLLTPDRFAAWMEDLSFTGLTVEVMRGERLAAEGFGGLLAVGGASANPPCLVVMRWNCRPGVRPVVFVGKGITFDTGGVCVKPAQGMWEMRADMAGAAACAGAMAALASRRSPAAAVAVLPLAENALGAASYRPGDVLTLHGGTTVEVVDTDAEGRLVLADALHWATTTLEPRAVIDLATLTGSIITALGHHMAGMFATDDGLAACVAESGGLVGERVWRMPLAEGYREQLSSDIADVRQCSSGGMQPDACHAALFLRGFVGQVPWVHLDIAGVESHETASDRHGAGPTGWGARLLDRLVMDQFEGR